MSTPRFESVDDYIASLDPVKAKTVRAVLDYIVATLPGLETKLAWNVPQVHRNGKYVFGIAAYKNHIAVAAWNPQIVQDFKPRLEGYVVNKGTFQIPVDWKVDKKLLKDLVQARLDELDRNAK